jgi:hypothetical protein
MLDEDDDTDTSTDADADADSEGDADADADDEGDDEDDDRPDLLLRESARIVGDMVELGIDEPTLARYFGQLSKDQESENLN